MTRPVRPLAVMGFYFFPRGGSAQVARSLCLALADTTWAPTVLSGSLGTSKELSNAARFFKGIRCSSLDYSPARARWDVCGDAMGGAVPMHASYEEKSGVPDRLFVDLDDAAEARQVTAWTKMFADHAGGAPRLVHLHHLTPMHEAVRALWPSVPLVTHLHGTELKMMKAVEDGTIVDRVGRFNSDWTLRLRRWATSSDRVVVVSEQDRQLAVEHLGVDDSRVSVIANGVDTKVFVPRRRPVTERLALWKRWLVDDPRGWRPGASVGSIRYGDDDLDAFTDEMGRPVPVVVFAGRFMRFKRVQLLIESHHRMRALTSVRSVLVIVGGFPGEWEGEHPYDTARRLNAKDVFFVGWRDHDDLADILSCCDVFAAPSVEEPFGLVYLEAMAAGLPPIATNTGGPRTFINVDPLRPTGWLVPPDDVTATAQALAEAVSSPRARSARGLAASRFVRERYSWTAAAAEVVELYRAAVDETVVV